MPLPKKQNIRRSRTRTARRRTPLPRFPKSRITLRTDRPGISLFYQNQCMGGLLPQPARNFFHSTQVPKHWKVMEVSLRLQDMRTTTATTRGKAMAHAMNFLLHPQTMARFAKQGITAYVGYTKNPTLLRYWRRRGALTSSLSVTRGADFLTEGLFHAALLQKRRPAEYAQHAVTLIIFPFPPIKAIHSKNWKLFRQGLQDMEKAAEKSYQ